MKAAIASSGGVPSVTVTLSEMQERQTKNAVSWEGVSFVNNIEYESQCLRVWKANNMGPGKIVPWSRFDAPAIAKELSLIFDLGNERNMHLPFVALKPQTLTSLSETTSSDGRSDHGSASDFGSSSSELFSCPAKGCVMTYQRYSSLERHNQCGKHKQALEQETLLDRAMLRYAYELEKGGSKVVELCDVACSRKETDYQVP